MAMRGDNALILMGKVPSPGKVKTRLCPPLSPREAAALYACLLGDIAGETERLRGVRRYLFHTPPGAGSYFRGDPFGGFLRRPQSGIDLGDRMARAAEEVFSEGARRVVIVGGDCPALSAGRIRAAFRELSDGADSVFGPAEDGGFYLVGLSARAPFLFREVAWSTPAVLASVLGRCRSVGMTYALLPPEWDVDTAADLESLRRWIRTHASPRCPRTRRWISASTREESVSAPIPGR